MLTALVVGLVSFISFYRVLTTVREWYPIPSLLLGRLVVSVALRDLGVGGNDDGVMFR